jgi:hypothetical protein
MRRLWLVAGVTMLAVFGVMTLQAPAQADALPLPTSSFAAAPSNCYKTFFGLKPWYYYLNLDKNCEIQNFTFLGSGSGILLILLAIIDDLLRIAGLVAVGFVIYAGIRYVTSQGSPVETGNALSSLIDALIGLVISMMAIRLLAFIGNKFGTGGGTGAAVKTTLDVSALPTTAAGGDQIKLIISVVLGIVGALSLLFVTIGGFRYVLSQGDPQATSKAKDTILYALIGLLITALAQAIVTFVIGRTS